MCGILFEAQQSGFDEVVLLNERGEVSECTAANIFCVREGGVLTPPLSSGCLAGITRSVMLEIGPLAGIAVEERMLMPDDLFPGGRGVYFVDEPQYHRGNRNRWPAGRCEIQAGYGQAGKRHLWPTRANTWTRTRRRPRSPEKLVSGKTLPLLKAR